MKRDHGFVIPFLFKLIFSNSQLPYRIEVDLAKYALNFFCGIAWD